MGGARRAPDSEGIAGTAEWTIEGRPRAEGIYERVEYDLVGPHRLQVKEDFEHPVEIRLGRDERTPSCYLVREPGNESPASESGFAVVQPSVVHGSQSGRGRCAPAYPLAVVEIGRAESPELVLGPDVSRQHCKIALDHLDIGHVFANRELRP
jgi:hypothetical protein